MASLMNSFYLLVPIMLAGIFSTLTGCGSSGGSSSNNQGNITQVVTGYGHTCALLNNGQVKCWGENSFGQLGLGDTEHRGDQPDEMGGNLPAVDLGSGRYAVEIAASSQTTCARLDNNQVKCWGDNDSGQLGLGDTEHRGDQLNEMGDNLPAINLGTGRSAIQIVAGTDNICAVLDNNQVKCWGANGPGNLGLGDINNRGDQPNEMGDNLPTVDLGTGRSALKISLGGYHPCALLDNGQVKCWGWNIWGQLGLGDTINRGDQSSTMGDYLLALDFGTGRSAVEIKASEHDTCARLDNGQVKCWGYNGDGRLGLGDTNDRGDQTNEMGDNLPAINLGTGRSATSLAMGGARICTRLDNNQLKCWGQNGTGNLGLGDTDFRGDQLSDMGDNLPAINLGTGRTASEISVGTYHSCALLDNAQVKCWGYNTNGRLGLGDTNHRGDQPNEMGDYLPNVSL